MFVARGCKSHAHRQLPAGRAQCHWAQDQTENAEARWLAPSEGYPPRRPPLPHWGQRAPPWI